MKRKRKREWKRKKKRKKREESRKVRISMIFGMEVWFLYGSRYDFGGISLFLPSLKE